MEGFEGREKAGVQNETTTRETISRPQERISNRRIKDSHRRAWKQKPCVDS